MSGEGDRAIIMSTLIIDKNKISKLSFTIVGQL